jgi:hypothetical protein
MPTPANAYQDAARDCAALVTLLHRALADHRADPDWADVGDLQTLRQRLYDALLPTRNCLDETEAKIAAIRRAVTG